MAVSVGSIRVCAGCLGAVSVLVLAGCGTPRKITVSVLSQDQNPVPHALVAVAGARVTGTTDQQGLALLPGFRPGVYEIIASARGYYATTTKRRLSPGKAVAVELRYRPPIGTFVWNIGPDGEYWDEGTVTKAGITATEYDWSCSRDPRTGKEVGSWLKFSGAQPYAVAPDAIAPEWVRRQFPASGPPTPPSGCRDS
jgi:hypothetical protein